MINPDAFLRRIGEIAAQRNLAEHALESLLMNAEAIDDFASTQIEMIQEALLKGKKLVSFDVKQSWPFSAKGIESFKSGSKSTLPLQVDNLRNRLRQNQLILYHAVTESFLKDIHREILRQDPSLLKPERKIEFQEVLNREKAEIIQGEIESAVVSLDREKPRKRINKLVEMLDIDWIEKKDIEQWENVNDLRNKIMHEDQDLKLTEEILDFTFVICMNLPIALVVKGTVKYPNGFEWNGVDTRKILGGFDNK